MLNKTGTHTPKAWTKDTNGYPTTTNGTTASIACAVQTLSASESQQYEHLQGKRLVVIYTMPGVTIHSDDTITVESVVYKVKAPAEDMGGRGRAQRLIAEVLGV